MFLKSLYAAALAVAFTSAANAATTRFDFFYAPSNGAWVDELNFNVDGIGLTVTGGPEDNAKVRHWQGHGLGVYGGSGDSSHQIDSHGWQDVVNLSFDKDVQIIGLKFSYVHDNDTFDFYVDGSEVMSAVALPNSYYASFSFTEEFISSSFGIGAGKQCYEVYSHYYKSTSTVCNKSAFKLKYVDVMAPEPIPLPATGVLLIAGLAGVGALRRRK